MNADVMGETISTIVSAAFTPRAAGGGFIGSTISTACRYGIARGLFSNESGMGSAPLVAAAAQTGNPKRQALVSMTGTFSTMLGWYYYGERCAVYLFGEKIILTYKIIWIGGILLGSLAELKMIWNIADVLNGLMTIPNIVAVLLLSGMIAAETKKYSGKHIDDKDGSEIPIIQNSKKGILM